MAKSPGKTSKGKSGGSSSGRSTRRSKPDEEKRAREKKDDEEDEPDSKQDEADADEQEEDEDEDEDEQEQEQPDVDEDKSQEVDEEVEEELESTVKGRREKRKREKEAKRALDDERKRAKKAKQKKKQAEDEKIGNIGLITVCNSITTSNLATAMRVGMRFDPSKNTMTTISNGLSRDKTLRKIAEIILCNNTFIDGGVGEYFDEWITTTGNMAGYKNKVVMANALVQTYEAIRSKEVLSMRKILDSLPVADETQFIKFGAGYKDEHANFIIALHR